jgi:putative endonuclease
MSNDLRHRLGRVGEQLAAEHLERRGFAILARNHRTRWGEIDLIAADARRIVFCEVKTRRAGAAARPFDGLREAQCRRLRRMAAAWLQHADRPRTPELRFDAIGVTIDAYGRLVAPEHLEGAF